MLEKIKNNKNYVKALALVLAAVLCFTLLSKAFTSESFLADKIKYLDEKKTTVMEMSAVAIAASAAITLVPGDAGTPIAEKLADLSKYSIIILSAVFLEKYLLNITALAAFRIIVPVGLLLIAAYFAFGKQRLYRLGMRLVLCGVLLFAVIPVSVGVSKAIESTYQTTINQTMQDAKEDTNEIEENAEDQNALQKFFNGIVGGAKAVVQKFEKNLTRMIEAFAVMLVTSVLIPLIVYVIMWFILKSTFMPTGGREVVVKLPDGTVIPAQEVVESKATLSLPSDEWKPES